ncbi:MAG: hypothetical protein ACPGJR_01510 [Akkermansiaceae bacterium]
MGIKTHHLDALAAGGLWLTQFDNTGSCCSSRASILSGQFVCSGDRAVETVAGQIGATFANAFSVFL